ncbi:MAG: DUF1559 domain-containing protein [Planctomycetes bacterium]|nr:DUF1559 domain-containing protein [Planctomycetota bacterium]
MAIISILIGLFFPAISTPRPVARSTICSTHLAQIARALHNYHFMYGSFPPAYVADDRDKPMHSWRVLILPFLGQQQLYDAHRFDEPWDGPNNSKLLTFVPWGYTCGAPQAGSKTSYFAVVGPDAAWSGAAAQSLDDFDGGSDAAILVLEGPADQIEWSEPRDLTWDETIELLTATPNDEGLHTDDEGFFFTRSYGRNAAMADGSVRRLPPNLSRAAAASLLHVASEDAADELDSGNHDAFRRRINWANVFRLIVLVIIVALPVPWAMRRRPLPKHRDPSAPS